MFISWNSFYKIIDKYCKQKRWDAENQLGTFGCAAGTTPADIEHWPSGLLLGAWAGFLHYADRYTAGKLDIHSFF